VGGLNPVTQVAHESRPPDVPHLLEALGLAGVRYILIGSVAAQLYGIETQPGDLDITPALDRANLAHLAGLLLEIEATLPVTEKVGAWELQADGKRKRATKIDAHGQEVWVVHVDELLTALTTPRRRKDASRVQQLREVQRRLHMPRSGENL
jgi:hypothetical protein